MTEFENVNQNSSEETIDIKALVRKFAGYWYYFILSIIVYLFIAFLYNRYTKKTYRVSTTIEIRDDNNSQLGVENIIEGMEMFSVRTNLENEIAIFESHVLAEKTIQELNLGVSYFEHNTIQTVNVYKNSPFNIVFDSNHVQLADIEFKIIPKEKDKFKLEFNCDEHYVYNLKTSMWNQKIEATLNYNATHTYNQPIETDYFSFIIKTPSNSSAETIELNKNYSFKLHSLHNQTKQYVKLLNVQHLKKEGSVLVLSISGPNRKIYIDYLNKLTELYLNQEMTDKNRMSTNTLRFINNQIIKTKDSLRVIENRLQSFKHRNPNLDIYDNIEIFKSTEDTRVQISQFQIKLSYYKELLSYLQSTENPEKIISPTSIGIINPELNTLISSFITLNAKKKELDLSTKESHPKYQSVLQQISFTKKSIIENLKNLISSTNIAKSIPESEIESKEKDMEQYRQNKEMEYVKLKREFIQAGEIVKMWNEKHNTVEGLKEGTVQDHKILDGAEKIPSENPLSPRPLFSYILSLLFGILTPIIFISIKDFFNETIRSKSDLIKITKIPVLGVIGNSDKGNNLVVSENPKSIIAESFRSLRTNIQYLAADKKSKVVTVTSSVGSEGKTFCSSNLALILASAGYKTILLGADLRKPRTHEDFKLSNTNGLSSFLINQSSLEDIIRTSQNENLKIITSGPIPPNPAELLNSGKMKDLIEDLKKDYEYIIIDTPPSGLVTDSVITMKFSDVNLYVVRHNYTKRNMLSIINDLHNTNQVKNLNIIINDYMVSSSSYGYGYAYGYGYGYAGGYGYYE